VCNITNSIEDNLITLQRVYPDALAAIIHVKKDTFIVPCFVSIEKGTFVTNYLKRIKIIVCLFLKKI